MRKELEEISRTHLDQFSLWYTLDRPPVGIVTPTTLTVLTQLWPLIHLEAWVLWFGSVLKHRAWECHTGFRVHMGDLRVWDDHVEGQSRAGVWYPSSSLHISLNLRRDSELQGHPKPSSHTAITYCIWYDHWPLHSHHCSSHHTAQQALPWTADLPAKLWTAAVPSVSVQPPQRTFAPFISLTRLYSLLPSRGRKQTEWFHSRPQAPNSQHLLVIPQ